MTPIKARSRRPTTREVSMLERKAVASCDDITVAEPFMTE